MTARWRGSQSKRERAGENTPPGSKGLISRAYAAELDVIAAQGDSRTAQLPSRIGQGSARACTSMVQRVSPRICGSLLVFQDWRRAVDRARPRCAETAVPACQPCFTRGASDAQTPSRA